MKKRIKHRRQLKTLDSTAFYYGPAAYARFDRAMHSLLTVSKSEVDAKLKQGRTRPKRGGTQ